MTRVLCSIYKSSKKDEMYLYVPKADGLKQVPEVLLSVFGTPRHVTDMMLTPERKLGRADIAQVLAKLAEQGFYLQLPPPPEAWLINSGDAPAWRRQTTENRSAEEPPAPAQDEESAS